MKSALTLIIFFATSFPSAAAAFTEAFAGKLIKLDPTSGEVLPHSSPDWSKTEYFMIYFSAHWCQPCRKLTPALVRFYNETRVDHPEFEFILVSQDSDQKAMTEYIRWAQMPWPALAWDQRAAIPEIAELRPRGIPFMAMFDKQGQLHGASEMGAFSIGVPKLINGLQEKLGIKVYDVRERHGNRRLTPFIYIAAAALALALIYFLKKRATQN